MKALKITVVALVIVVAGLLVAVRRLADQVHTPGPAATQAAVENPAPPPIETAASPPAENRERAPVLAPKRVTRPKPANAPSHSAEAGGAQNGPPSPAKTTEPETAAAAAPPPTPPVAAAPAAPENPAPPAPSAPPHVTLPAGTQIVVRTQNTLSTERNVSGDTFVATLDEPLVADGFVIAEKGAQVEGVVSRAVRAGRVEGTSELAVELVRLHTTDGQTVAIATDLHDAQGQRSRGSDAKKIGAATGIGAIIGAIAGGGKGAAIGAGVGAGAGGGAVLATRGKDVSIPSESRLVFRLKTPVEITERP